ncbi:hypothetical protein JD520_02000 [Aeromonas jandaei]|nr:hypothetical protein [Aeromonas jandaei]
MFAGKERRQLVDAIESAIAQEHTLYRQDLVGMAILIQNSFTCLQCLYETLASIGHGDAGASNEAGLGICLGHLPLLMGKVIAKRVGK